MRGIHKSFAAVVALNGAHLEVLPGEIMALLGSNGSGKSTMIKILAGLYKPNSGEILFDGTPVAVNSGRDAHAHGIATAFQDLSIVGTMTVIDNIMLGREYRGRAGFIDRDRQYAEVRELLNRFNLDCDPDAFAQTLMPSAQSMVEVAKAVHQKPRLLLLDEVTASLHNDEIQVLFKVLRELKDEGVAIVYVTHRMNEIFEICDRATIMRNGETMAVEEMKNLTLDNVVYHMTGQRFEPGKGLGGGEAHAFSDAAVTLKADRLKIGPIVKDISLEAHKGEIVGIGGLEGQGQPEVIRSVLGALQPDDGNIEYLGGQARFHSVYDAVKRDIGFVSGERGREAIFPTRTVAENIAAGLSVRGSLPAVVLPSRIRRYAQKAVDSYKIVIGSIKHPADSLSGGNQQKLVIARWLSENPKLLLLDDPTKGVDVHSRAEIHNILRECANNGMTIIISSSDNEELLDLADTIYIFYEGRVSAVLRGQDKTDENFVAGMLGLTGGGEAVMETSAHTGEVLN